MVVRSNDIIFILGAGASADSGIPVLSKMEDDVKSFIKDNDDWKKYYQLYHLLKASYNYSYEIQGKTPYFNLEILLNTIQELLKKEEHPIYPFIGSWIVKFNEVIKEDFDLLKHFDTDIRKKLVEWVTIDNERRQKIDYFKHFIDFRKEMNFPLNIFTLNYDLCVELALKDSNVERGFEVEENGYWNFRRFIEPSEDVDIFLYKLHGSVDWKRDNLTQKLTFSNAETNSPDWIFGTQYKMQYIDPYLFLFSEFRRKIFEAKIIVCIGYSFFDEHINGVINDALRDNKERKILSISHNLDLDEIAKRPNIDERILEQIKPIKGKKAREFLSKDLSRSFFEEYFEIEDF